MAKAHSRFLTTGLIAALVMISAYALIPRTGCSGLFDWTSHFYTSGTSETYLGQDQTFTFYIHNDGDVAIDIWDYKVQFGWDLFTTTYTLVDSTHVTIAPGTDSIHYDLERRVPDSTYVGEHMGYIFCIVQREGEVTVSHGWWNFHFDVEAVPTMAVSSPGANPTSGAAPLTVTFDPSLSGGLPPYSYSWDFGDGDTSTSATPSHIYEKAGNFTATVVVTDTETVSQVRNASVVITVFWRQLSVTGVAWTSPESLSVHFTCTPIGGCGGYDYSWDFGDQSSPSDEQNPTHVYSIAGTYAVVLTLTDSGTNSTQWVHTVTVTEVIDEPPIEDESLPSVASLAAMTGALAVVVIGVVFAVLHWRKGSGKGPAPPQQRPPEPPLSP